MKSTNSKMMGLMSAAALALGAQQASAIDITVSNDVSVNTTWSSANVYKMDRLIFVKNGATLTIQPGTVIRGLPDSGGRQQPGTLLISRGSKINAQGTAANPIVFTDQYDDSIGSNPGSTNNPNGYDYGKLNNQLTGQWGGLILAGKSYIAWDGMNGVGVYTPDGRVSAAIEGLTSTSDINYGGANDLDNSGVVKYVSLRYGGFILGPSKEINGLTLCGVGRGTTLDHIDVYNTKDDSVEFFGGTVNMKHFVTWNGTDDGIDTDTGWRGKIQFALVVQGISTLPGPGQSLDCSDKALEWDGAGDKTGFNDDPQSAGAMFNFTLIGMGKDCGDLANTAFNIRDNAGARLYNGIVMDFSGAATLLEGVTSGTWAYGTNCSALKMSQTYAQDNYFTSGTNRQGVALTYAPANINYIGYPDVIPGSKKVEFKSILFWNMGIPHSIGFTNGFDTTEGQKYVGTDNASPYSTRAYAGAYPIDTGYDIVASNNPNVNLAFSGTEMPAPSWTPINYYERETTVYSNKPTFRSKAYPYTCVKLIDPRENSNYWAAASSVTVQPPADGFYTPVQFIGAMGKKNWAGPWSTPWRLGGFVTNNVATGDEDSGIVTTMAAVSGGVDVTLDPDVYTGFNADWWMAAVKSTGQVYYFNFASGWVLGLATSYQGPLFAVPTAATFPTATLPSGTYDIYFGIDLVKDGLLTFDQLHFSTVNITK